jgi:hypothetical protein
MILNFPGLIENLKYFILRFLEGKKLQSKILLKLRKSKNDPYVIAEALFTIKFGTHLRFHAWLFIHVLLIHIFIIWNSILISSLIWLSFRIFNVILPIHNYYSKQACYGSVIYTFILASAFKIIFSICSLDKGLATNFAFIGLSLMINYLARPVDFVIIAWEFKRSESVNATFEGFNYAWWSFFN